MKSWRASIIEQLRPTFAATIREQYGPVLADDIDDAASRVLAEPLAAALAELPAASPVLRRHLVHDDRGVIVGSVDELENGEQIRWRIDYDERGRITGSSVVGD